ncbi:hypothetical protein AURDEDRAFT_178542 [Auricularia subglabra TFB-10046 SS5]|uniref:Uncharacterized protein n=1 Tax=Auricularia subglabra (strain TFB-10046 / SS5) TaxID=717982 RepID=J0L7T5_AURST|nr:hypothetical protein AURDEDRAFT_178542 [Auricularia subglabra TFB-10046 SS5]
MLPKEWSSQHYIVHIDVNDVPDRDPETARSRSNGFALGLSLSFNWSANVVESMKRQQSNLMFDAGGASAHHGDLLTRYGHLRSRSRRGRPIQCPGRRQNTRGTDREHECAHPPHTPAAHSIRESTPHPHAGVLFRDDDDYIMREASPYNDAPTQPEAQAPMAPIFDLRTPEPPIAISDDGSHGTATPRAASPAPSPTPASSPPVFPRTPASQQRRP